MFVEKYDALDASLDKLRKHHANLMPEQRKIIERSKMGDKNQNCFSCYTKIFQKKIVTSI